MSHAHLLPHVTSCRYGDRTGRSSQEALVKKPSKRTARVGVLVAGAVGLVGALLPSQVEAAPAAPALVVPAWSNQDPITGCRDEYDSGVVGNSPIAFGLLQNDIPRGITISKWMLGDPIPGTGNRRKVGTVYGKGRLVTSEAPEVWLGQRTPIEFWPPAVARPIPSRRGKIRVSGPGQH